MLGRMLLAIAFEYFARPRIQSCTRQTNQMKSAEASTTRKLHTYRAARHKFTARFLHRDKVSERDSITTICLSAPKMHAIPCSSRLGCTVSALSLRDRCSTCCCDTTTHLPISRTVPSKHDNARLIGSH